MGRVAYDPADETVWSTCVKVGLHAREVDTDWGPTRLTEALDTVVVQPRVSAKWDRAVDVSAGSPGAKLEPRLDARGGAVCVTWCACHPYTKQWHAYASYFSSATAWTKPMPIVGDHGPVLHPDVALDPTTGVAWIAYEDWTDGSIRLTRYDGNAWSEPIAVSSAGKNSRPRVIVTAADGKHAGAVAVAWDSYRDRQYDIYLRLLDSAGNPGPEHRVTQCARWDSCVDLLEDHDNNLWLTWVRASNELGDMSAMRDVHVKLFDGERFLYPAAPDHRYSQREMGVSTWLKGAKSPPARVREEYRARHVDEDHDGRVTWYKVTWSPTLQVDERNRVYVFYREGDLVFPPILGRLMYRVYEGRTWSKPRKLKLGRGPNILCSLRDYSVVVAGRVIEGVWDRAYMNVAKEVLSVRPVRNTPIRSAQGSRFVVEGEAYAEALHAGWSQKPPEVEPPTDEVDGQTLTLLFGDTHNHSALSIGVDPPDYHFHYARDFAGFDFFALPENDYLFCGIPGMEAYNAFLPKAFDSQDFVCFQAHEVVSSSNGHRVMLFEGHDKPLFPLGVFNSQRGDRANTAGHMYSFLHAYATGPDERAFVCPHNMTLLGNDYHDYDETLEPLYDVASVHFPAEKTHDEYRAEGIKRGTNLFLETLLGLSLIPLGGKNARSPRTKWYYSFRQCLDAGLRLGVYGSSDNHVSNGLGWVLSGVWATAKTKRAILDALFARRTIALDGQLRMTDIFDTDPVSTVRVMDQLPVRADIRFSLNGHFLGTQCWVDAPPELRVSVTLMSPHDSVRRVIVVRNGHEVFAFNGFGERSVSASWTDDGWGAGRCYYYLRVELESGALGYSSPVFVNYDREGE